MTIAEESARLEQSAMRYGVQFDGTLVGAEYHASVKSGEDYTLAELRDAGGKISRIRVLTGLWPGRGHMGDISYIHATLPNGDIVRVSLSECPDSGIGIQMTKFNSWLIQWAQAEKVYGKSIGLLETGVRSIIWGD